jgi:hypothetical protein
MAGAKIVKVTVDDNTGEFDVVLTGYHGQGCDAIIEAFGELGAITSHVHKPEFRATATKKINQGA